MTIFIYDFYKFISEVIFKYLVCSFLSFNEVLFLMNTFKIRLESFNYFERFFFKIKGFHYNLFLKEF